VLPGLLLLAAALALRGASRNRHVRGRLMASAVAFALDLAFVVADRSGLLAPPIAAQAAPLAPMLLAFGLVNALVALVINPWRSDRVPERFPRIVQDTIVIGLMAAVALAVLQERVFAATAAGAVVLGLALQDTLGNFFAGLAIQIDKPFRVGHWVRVLGNDGMVTEVTWRATKLRTKTGNFVVVPNSVLSKDTIVNYSEPTEDTRLEFEVGASYNAHPNQVKETILEAIRDEPLMSRTVAPEVLLVAFGDHSITYRVRVWLSDFAADERLKDNVRTAIYYAFGRVGIEIPFPIRTVIMQEASPRIDVVSEADAALAQVPIFTVLSAEQRGEVARAARREVFGTGESIVRQGESGESMFVLVSGEAAVLVGESRQEVARIRSGGFFGEMSLLTGATRNATVRATRDCELLEITAEAFRGVVLAHPAALEHVTRAAARRQAELDQARASGAAQSAAEHEESLLDVVRKFFRIQF
jgi:hypothetical protein